MPAIMPERVPVAIPVAAILVGLAMAILAAARPEFFWELGRVRKGREWLGDAAMTGLFVGLGLVLVGLGANLLRKR
jgi:hypothetical protein